MKEWTNYPRKDGPYWFSPGDLSGDVALLLRLVYTTPNGERYVSKFGDDWDLSLSEHYDENDLWLPIEEPAAPIRERHWSKYRHKETSLPIAKEDPNEFESDREANPETSL